MLSIEQYREAIQLDTPTPSQGVVGENRIKNSRAEVLEKALQYYSSLYNFKIPHPEEYKRQLLRSILIRRAPFDPFPDEVNTILASETATSHQLLVTSLPFISQTLPTSKFDFSHKVILHQGDITNLKIDAIVNAANPALLGCFQPTHRCIDNIIHAKAGPQLRDDCSIIINLQGKEEQRGECKVTRGYHLPSRYIFHTVGPELPPLPIHAQSTTTTINTSHQIPTLQDCLELASCYAKCLNECNNLKIQSIAFPCISTGIYGFPQYLAAKIVLATLRDWLLLNPQSTLKYIVINTFQHIDTLYYQSILLSPQNIVNQSLQSLLQSPLPSPFSSSSSISDEISVDHTSGVTTTHVDDDVITHADSTDTAANTAVTNRAIVDIINDTPSSSQLLQEELNKAAEEIKEAEAILITGGAGISASAGLDYTDTKLFSELFPDMFQRGFRCMYDFIGHHFEDPQLQWGYLSRQIMLARFTWPEHPVYGKLLEIVEKKPYFVCTTNADGMFERNHFNRKNIYTPQGEYSLLQCLKRCTEDVWDSYPILSKLLEVTDKQTGKVTNPSLIPQCPNCGGSVFLNVNGGSWFIQTHRKEQKRQYYSFIKSYTTTHTNNADDENNNNINKKKFVILDIGTGFNTPSVIRWPVEELARTNSNITLIRINGFPKHAEVPQDIKHKSIELPLDAFEAISAIHSNLFNK